MTADRPDQAKSSHSHLGVRIADRSCLVDLALAGELMPVPERVLPVPLSQPWLIGVFSLRGQLMTLIDLARYRGWGQSELGKGSRVLAFGSVLRFNAAILIDEVHGLHTPDAQPVRDFIDLKALIREPAFLMVSRLTLAEKPRPADQDMADGRMEAS